MRYLGLLWMSVAAISGCKPGEEGAETQSRNQAVGEMYEFSTNSDKTVFVFDSAIGKNDAVKVIPKGIAENLRCTIDGKRTLKGKFLGETRKGILRTILRSKQYQKVEIIDWGGAPCREKIGYFDSSQISEPTTPAAATTNQLLICRRGTPAEDRVCGDFSPTLRKSCLLSGMGNDGVCNGKKEWSKNGYINIQRWCEEAYKGSIGSGLLYRYENCGPYFEHLQKETSQGGEEEKTYVNDRVWVCTASVEADSVCGVFTPQEVAACRALDGGDVCGTAEDQKNRVQRRWGKVHYYKVLDKLKGK